MEYLLDTVTLIRHFTGSGKIGKTASQILSSSSEHKFLISVVSLMEILYLSEKNRIEINLEETLDKINSSSLYSVIDLTPQILEMAQSVKFYELHDRLILSTAKWLGIPVISSDEEFETVDNMEIIWN
jgi:PIN domain nuclease of toxin-antitoxin system